MSNRRAFLGSVIGGSAGMAMAAAAPGAAGRIRGANSTHPVRPDRRRIARQGNIAGRRQVPQRRSRRRGRHLHPSTR